jgi:hypothetical protein
MLNVCIRPQPAVAGVPCDCSHGRGNFIRRNPGRANCRWQQTCYAGRHRTSVFVSHETLAEDVLSEVFLDVWRQAARFECRSSVSTWLLSIARHKALSARRRRTEAQLDEKIEATVADPADDPSAGVRARARRARGRAVVIVHSRERLGLGGPLSICSF